MALFIKLGTHAFGKIECLLIVQAVCLFIYLFNI